MLERQINFTTPHHSFSIHVDTANASESRLVSDDFNIKQRELETLLLLYRGITYKQVDEINQSPKQASHDMLNLKNRQTRQLGYAADLGNTVELLRGHEVFSDIALLGLINLINRDVRVSNQISPISTIEKMAAASEMSRIRPKPTLEDILEKQELEIITKRINKADGGIKINGYFFTINHLEILTHISMGCEQVEIAKQTGRSPQTIKNTLQDIKRFNMDQQTEKKPQVGDLVRFCDSIGLLDFEIIKGLRQMIIMRRHNTKPTFIVGQ